MEYFTLQLLEDINSTSEEIRERADAKWDENCIAYGKRFEQNVKERLPKKVSQFNWGSFHDGQLIKMEISQGEYGKKYPVTVNLYVKKVDDSEWMIQYKNVKGISFVYPVGKSLWRDIGTENYSRSEAFAQTRGFDDWLYFEFLDVDNTTLSNEILFGSGTTLLIQFPDKKISIKKLG